MNRDNSPVPEQRNNVNINNNNDIEVDSDDSAVDRFDEEDDESEDDGEWGHADIEEVDEQPILSEDEILQIKNNSVNIDPYLSLEYIEDGLSNSSTNWAELGSYIGANTRIQHLDVDASVNEEPWDDDKMSRKFFDKLPQIHQLNI